MGELTMNLRSVCQQITTVNCVTNTTFELCEECEANYFLDGDK